MQDVKKCYTLAIDLGTTGCRSIIFDFDLHIVADSYQEYGLETPHENWVEQNALLWWDLSKETIKNAIQKAKINPSDIRGISVSSQGITIVPVDENLDPLRSALSWLDVRADKETEFLLNKFGAREMFTLTGKQINPCYSLPKILWLKNHQPEIFSKTKKLLMPMDFLISKLTGIAVTDHSMASGTLLYDIKQGCWSEDVLNQCEIDIKLLPEIKWSGEVVGNILPQVAKELGLSKDCLVTVGAQDQRCASLGVGLKEGIMTISLGTSCAVCKYEGEPKTEGDMRVGWSAYIHENSWVTEGVVNTAAVCLRWLRDTMFTDIDYAAIDEEAYACYEQSGTLIFYPYLNGQSSPDNYPDSEGSFYGVNLATKRGDFALAVLEGVAFQIRIMLEAMGAYGSIHTLVLFGGGSKSKLWCQIVSDITGIKIIVPDTSEAAGAGAAILAGMGIGCYEREKLPKINYKKEYVPKNQEIYSEKYKKYRSIEKKLWG